MKYYSLILSAVLLVVLFSPVIASEDHHSENHICFYRIDTNQDGTVTEKELIKAYPDEKELLKKIDLDNDNQITHEEYEEYWAENE